MQKYDSLALEQAASLSDFLQNEFTRRLKKNPSYSLRAFARDLEISSSRLSEVFNLKRGVSQQTLEKMSERLKLAKRHKDILNDLYLIQSSKSAKIKEHAHARLNQAKEKNRIKRLDKNIFKIINEWYHPAIIELIQVTGFTNNPAWIAKKLGISSLQASEAVQRLLEVGLLKEVDGKFEAPPDITLANSETPFEAMRVLHRELMQKARLSFEKDPNTRREFNSMIVAIPQDSLPEFKKEIQVFMQKFWESLPDKPKDDLYCLNVQFFPVTRGQNE